MSGLPMIQKPFASLILCLFLNSVFSGCATYITPGTKADLDSLAPDHIQKRFQVKPSNPFPAIIALVRLQGPNYSNYYIQRHGGLYGKGLFSVVTIKEVEEEAHLESVIALPQINGVVSLNRMLLPNKFNGDLEIRGAASKLHADLVFLYTFDTAFYHEDASKPLTAITLGLSPTRKIRATTTASALLMDTRTGYVYSAYETTESQEIQSNSWASKDSADLARRVTEKHAFNKLVHEFADSWPRLLDQYKTKALANI